MGIISSVVLTVIILFILFIVSYYFYLVGSLFLQLSLQQYDFESCKKI